MRSSFSQETLQASGHGIFASLANFMKPTSMWMPFWVIPGCSNRKFRYIHICMPSPLRGMMGTIWTFCIVLVPMSVPYGSVSARRKSEHIKPPRIVVRVHRCRALPFQAGGCTTIWDPFCPSPINGLKKGVHHYLDTRFPGRGVHHYLGPAPLQDPHHYWGGV